MAGSFFMGLSIPAVGMTIGPQYARMINDSLNLIDKHDHAEGNGARIPTIGIRINNDMPFNNYNLLSARSVRFKSQEAPFSNMQDLGCLFVSGVDLFYRDGSGNVIQLTIGGQISGASAGNITGLVAPASAAFAGGNAGGGTITWKQNSAWFARMLSGSVEIRDSTLNNPTNGITIKSPASLAAAYSLTLPTALPSQTSFLTVTSAGQLASGPATAGGIDTANLADGAVTKVKQAAVGQQFSPDSGIWFTPGTATTETVVTVGNGGSTEVKVSLVATGNRPILIAGVPAGGGGLGLFTVKRVGTDGDVLATLGLQAFIGATPTTHGGYFRVIGTLKAGVSLSAAPSMVMVVYVPSAGAGTYTFKLTYSVDPLVMGNGPNFFAQTVRLVAYEL